MILEGFLQLLDLSKGLSSIIEVTVFVRISNLNVSIVEDLACNITKDTEADSCEIQPLVVVVLILLILSIQSPQ